MPRSSVAGKFALRRWLQVINRELAPSEGSVRTQGHFGDTSREVVHGLRVRILLAQGDRAAPVAALAGVASRLATRHDLFVATEFGALPEGVTLPSRRYRAYA